MKKILIIAGIIVVVLIVIGALVSSGEETTSDTETASAQQEEQQTSNETQETKTEQPKKYQEVFTFSGNGAKKSEPFTITGDRFKVKYDCQGDLCQAYLYKVGEEIIEGLIMNTTDSVKDETIFYGAGEYYIVSNTLGTYTMTVEDYK